MPRPIGQKAKSVTEMADAAILRSGQSSRLKNLSQIEELTGFDRNEVSKWTKRGLAKDSKGPKGAVMIDMRTLIDFLVEDARADERRRIEKERPAAPPPPVGLPEGFIDYDTELTKEQILAQKLKTAERVGMLVIHTLILKSNAVIINGFRTSYEAINERVGRVLVGHDQKIVRAVKNEVKASSRDALISGQRQMDRDYLKLNKDVLSQYGVETDATFDVEHEDDFDEEQDDEDGHEPI